MSKKLNLVGQKYNRLTVLESKGSISGNQIFICRCDCGKITEASSASLRSGHKKSCGCLNRELPILQPHNLMGKHYGKLYVTNDCGKINGHHYFECLCECGNITKVEISNLTSGHTKSCGHCEKIIHENGHCRYICRNGASFIFDADDEEKVRKYVWSVSNYGYAVSDSKINGKRLILSRYLLNVNDDTFVDHINGNTLNNLRNNLRIATAQNNSQNMKRPAHNTSGYKGVSFNKVTGKYRAYITINKKFLNLGQSYNNPIDAAKAYDKAARYYFGNYCCLNFPNLNEQSCNR